MDVRNLQALAKVLGTDGAVEARVQSQPSRPAAVNLAGDEASLSTTAAAVSRFLETSDVRADKVASIQKAIADGTYAVSSGDVADKLITHMLG